jgi:hypothetical protein
VTTVYCATSLQSLSTGNVSQEEILSVRRFCQWKQPPTFLMSWCKANVWCDIWSRWGSFFCFNGWTSSLIYSWSCSLKLVVTYIWGLFWEKILILTSYNLDFALILHYMVLTIEYWHRSLLLFVQWSWNLFYPSGSWLLSLQMWRLKSTLDSWFSCYRRCFSLIIFLLHLGSLLDHLVLWFMCTWIIWCSDPSA